MSLCGAAIEPCLCDPVRSDRLRRNTGRRDSLRAARLSIHHGSVFGHVDGKTELSQAGDLAADAFLEAAADVLKALLQEFCVRLATVRGRLAA